MDAPEEIAALENRHQRFVFGSTPRALVLYEKHGNRLFYIASVTDLEKAALFVVKERLADGWYEDDKRLVGEIIAVGSGGGAWQFLKGRDEYEYEQVLLEHFENN